MRRPAMTAAAALVLLGGCGGGGEQSTPTATTSTAKKDQSGVVVGRPAPQRTAPSEKAIGIGDQNPGVFSAPLFRALHITKARRVVPWDIMQLKAEQQMTDQWLAEAKRAGVEPFITFSASRRKPKQLPTRQQYRTAFLAFRKRYPQVRVYAAWNEANHKSQPTAKHPDRAAAFYEVMRSNCRGCTVVAADVLDQAGFERYLARFRAAVHGPKPQLWGLHNYSDTNRFRTRGTRSMLRAVKGEIWLTETGGVASFGRSFPYDVNRQARATAYTFKLLKLSPRIRRLYIYNWVGAPKGARFDAGLTNPDGSPRPSYRTLERELK